MHKTHSVSRGIKIIFFHRSNKGIVPNTMQRGVSVKYEEGALYMNLLHFVQSSIKEKLDGTLSSKPNNAG
jgi:hypothetical protein